MIKTVLMSLLGMIVVAVGLVVVARLVFTLPPNTQKSVSTAMAPPPGASLPAAVADLSRTHADQTGIYPLVNGADAFAARMLLARQAQASIDVQYYIWHDDLTGTLLLAALKDAAARGVRVRLLVDDNGVSGLDAELAALDRLENFEVRLFNPFVIRRFKIVNYAFDFFRLNHRMHNKSFTVDNAASVIGGRNVGDEYFGTGPNSTFLDLDVLAIGAVVPAVSADFDRYWASAAAYPVAAIVGDAGDGLAALDATYERVSRTAQFSEYRAALEASPMVTRLLDRTLRLEWTNVALVSDDPDKVLGKVRREDLMISRLTSLIGSPSKTLDIVSAYFVPGRIGADQLTALERAGVKVRIMTNSFEATDVAVVHSGYAKYREELLDAGLEIYELKARGAPGMGRSELGLVGSSGSSLHAKTFSIDGRQVFVGSFNFDPRSALLNTEMGLMIDSEMLARGVTDLFDSGLVGLCYRPELENGAMTWSDVGEDGRPQIHDVEPGTTFVSRALVTVAGWLPVEWLL
jgi:putative cardiolipin synthase